MSTNQLFNLRSKFESILELSQDQLAALQNGDVMRFRHALAAKGAVIESIAGSMDNPITDPATLAIIENIQESERQSEILIKTRLSTTRQELAQMEQSKAATKAYTKLSRKTPSFVPSLETPLMFDHRR
jgi:hypothetical protein